MTDATPPTPSRLTRGLRTGLGRDLSEGAVVPPIYLSTNYTFTGLGEPRTYDYSRAGNPTRDLLGEALATLEGGAGGTITATGLGAATLVVTALVPAGGRVLAAHDAYGGTWRLFSRLAGQGHLTVEFVDFTDASAWPRALTSPVDLVWLESPSNPLLRITDLAAVTASAHAAGALVVVDNTFCSPLLQRPLEFGADVVVHSATKFINGHSDVVAGAVIAATDALHDQLRTWANVLGLTASPFDAYLALRGLRTLDARLRVHQENARALVDLLVGHPAVARVHYPGLPDHPGHDLATRQQDGFGSLVSFDLVGGRAAAERLVTGLTCFTLAESLGGTESLIAHPASMTHASMSEDALAAAGIGDGLLRLSVGLEALDDLVADLGAGLDRAL